MSEYRYSDPTMRAQEAVAEAAVASQPKTTQGGPIERQTSSQIDQNSAWRATFDEYYAGQISTVHVETPQRLSGEQFRKVTKLSGKIAAKSFMTTMKVVEGAGKANGKFLDKLPLKVGGPIAAAEVLLGYVVIKKVQNEL